MYKHVFLIFVNVHYNTQCVFGPFVITSVLTYCFVLPANVPRPHTYAMYQFPFTVICNGTKIRLYT